jgi:large subunit ribosomal protein L9
VPKNIFERKGLTMKVLLIKDVYNLGRAGEVKKVADGYARNFLLPQKLAVKATKGSINQVERIKESAAKQRELINAEMSELAEAINGIALEFTAKVGETGKLYGSITQQMIADAINEKINVNIDRHLLETQPLREVGTHTVKVRLTYDLIPEIQITVIGEGEAEEEVEAEIEVESAGELAEEAVEEEIPSEEAEVPVEEEETFAEEEEAPTEEE